MPDADRSSVELPLHLARSAFDAAPDAMLIVDMLGTIRHSNARVLELFGYRPDDLIGRSVEELLPERFRARDLDFWGGGATAANFRSRSA
jgi:PAS domain S-box-containing protein